MIFSIFTELGQFHKLTKNKNIGKRFKLQNVYQNFDVIPSLVKLLLENKMTKII